MLLVLENSNGTCRIKISLHFTLKAFIFCTYEERFLSYFKVTNSKYNIKLSFNKCFISVLNYLS